MYRNESPVLYHVPREGKEIRVRDLERFYIELQKLLEKERGQYSISGDLLILESRDNLYLNIVKIDYNKRIQLAESLIKSSFDDKGNWASEDKEYYSQVAWWRFGVKFDVVCLPGYTDREILHHMNRIFTRPTYLEQAIS